MLPIVLLSRCCSMYSNITFLLVIRLFFRIACFIRVVVCHSKPASPCHPERSEGSPSPSRIARRGRRSFAALRMTWRKGLFHGLPCQKCKRQICRKCVHSVTYLLLSEMGYDILLGQFRSILSIYKGDEMVQGREKTCKDTQMDTAQAKRRPGNTFLWVAQDTQTYRNILYLLLSFPLGTGYFVFLMVGLTLGLSTLIIWVGVPILIFTMSIWWQLATFERSLAIRLLGVTIAPMSYSPLMPLTQWQSVQAHLANPMTWKTFIYQVRIFKLMGMWCCKRLTGRVGWLRLNSITRT